MSDNEVTIQVEPYKAIRTTKARELTGLDKQQIDEFTATVGRAYAKGKPAEEDLKAIRKYLRDYPILSRAVFDVVDTTQSLTIKNMTGDFPAAQIAMEEQLISMRDELGYHAAPIMEKLLIENIITAWLHVQFCQGNIAFRLGRDLQISVTEFWERRLSMAQRRYLAACESLAKIRRMAIPALQLNIGDKQVNVAGNLQAGRRAGE